MAWGFESLCRYSGVLKTTPARRTALKVQTKVGLPSRALGGTGDAMVSNTIVHSDMWVRIPQRLRRSPQGAMSASTLPVESCDKLDDVHDGFARLPCRETWGLESSAHGGQLVLKTRPGFALMVRLLYSPLSLGRGSRGCSSVVRHLNKLAQAIQLPRVFRASPGHDGGASTPPSCFLSSLAEYFCGTEEVVGSIPTGSSEWRLTWREL